MDTQLTRSRTPKRGAMRFLIQRSPDPVPYRGAYFRFPDPGWSPERPAVEVTAWPPLPGAPLPELR
jgi:hypothetical protein